MRAGAWLRVGGYLAAVLAAFGVAFAVGAAAEPAGPSRTDQAKTGKTSTAHQEGAMSTDTDGGHAATEPTGSAQATLPGLAVAEAGYTLVPGRPTLSAGAAVPFRFTVTGPDGAPVTAYRESHEKELHLIVVRRDLALFQHVHPTRAADGAWSVPLDLPRAGTYRVFADFVPAGLGRGLTLGTDVTVAGAFRPLALPEAASTATTGGYDVALAGRPVAGEESELTFTIRRDGAEVADLQPYLGAFGHLVSLRTGDLAYLHTHPAEEAAQGARGGPQVRFATTFPTPGTYRVFLDFRHGGSVHTAAFTVEVPR